MDPLLTLYFSASGADLSSRNTELFTMDEDEIGIADTPAESGVMTPETDMEKQVASLKSYIDAMPYQCESVDEMQAKLEAIVGKIVICAKSANWLVLSTWDGLLQWYVLFF